MSVQFETWPEFMYRDRPVSALGLRLRRVREQIEAAAARGEVKLLNAVELEQELAELRPDDSDVR